MERRSFTLLELLVVFFIISIGAALTGVKVKELYQEQRFLSQSRQVIDHLSMAQDLMLIMNTDVRVKFEQDQKNEELTMWLEVEKPISDVWARIVERKVALPAIRSISFDGRNNTPIDLLFSFGSMSQGTLKLFKTENSSAQTKEENIFEISLPGYPSAIGSAKKSFNVLQKGERSISLYPVEAYEEIYKDDKKSK